MSEELGLSLSNLNRQLLLDLAEIEMEYGRRVVAHLKDGQTIVDGSADAIAMQRNQNAWHRSMTFMEMAKEVSA